MRQILFLAAKDVRLLVRDRVGFFFVLGFPVLYALFFGFIFKGAGETKPMSVLVVDEDSTEASAELLKKFEDAPEVEITRSSLDAAVNRVRKGRTTAYIRIPKGYGEAAQRPFWGGAPAIELGVDPSRKAEAGLLQGVITQYVAQDVFKIFTDPDAMRKQTQTAMEAVTKDDSITPVQKGIFSAFFGALDSFMTMVHEKPADGAATTDDSSPGAFGTKGWSPVSIAVKEVRWERGASEFPNNPMDITFPQSLVWGLMGCAAAFGISLVVERTRGTLIRLRLAPIARWHILAGKGAACFMMLIAVSLFLLMFAMLVFGVRPESYAHLALAILCAAVCYTGLMMMLSVAGRTEASAGGIGWAVLTFMAMIGGGMMPLFFMPTWMQSIASISPIKWTILAMEGAIFRGYTTVEMMLPCGILIGVGLLCFAVGSRVFTWTQAE